ncbi:MAG: hypothetical protein GBAus27B_000152 [Mycoplasmataceae bacterium]|nr:MAG: hypothetical protein GBAus27B_000152 [Mycoplasmataceae bacterium]
MEAVLENWSDKLKEIKLKKWKVKWTKESMNQINEIENKVFKKMETILKSHKDAYEKKIALFNCVKNIELKDLEPLEKRRVDYLLQGRLYNELAKQSMKEYN